MYCPLCHAGYREGVSACATCASPLLAQEAARPARVVWRVDHRELSRRVLAVLQTAGVACHHKSKFDHWVYAVLWRRPEFQVWILKEDMARAHAALAGMERSPEFEEEAPEVIEWPLLHCPFCGAEYPEGYSACPGCGIDLTQWMQTPFEPASDDAPEIVWNGSDPVSLSRVMDKLQFAEIPFSFRPTHEHLAFELGMPRPRWQVQVYGSDLPRALDLIADVTETFALVASEEPPDESAELSPGPGEASDANQQRRAAATFNPSTARAEAWAGRDAGLAQSLRLVLRENEIESWTVDDADGTQHLWVDGWHRERAQEIVKQVSGESQPIEP